MERDPNPLYHQLQKPLIAPVEGHEHFRSNLSVGRRIWPVQSGVPRPQSLGGSAARIFDEPRHYRFSRDRHWPKPVDLSVGAMAALGSYLAARSRSRERPEPAQPRRPTPLKRRTAHHTYSRPKRRYQLSDFTHQKPLCPGALPPLWGSCIRALPA